MNCEGCQLQIFDGELDRDAVVHLTECEDCRELEREIRLNSVALAELREEPLPVERRRRWQPWAAAIAAAAAALVIVLSAPRDFPHPPVIQAVDPPIVAEILPPADLPKPEIRIRRIRPVVKPKPKPVEQPMLVKFITDDPEVVVYWIVDPPNKGEPGL